MFMKSSTYVLIFFLLIALGACAGKSAREPGRYYEVYGGSKILTKRAGREPLRHGYRLLGRASGNETFYGTYPLYLILVGGGNVLRLDAIQVSDGSSLELNTVAKQNVRDHPKARGIPDMNFALVGINKKGRYKGGYLLLKPRSREIRSITIFVSQ